MQNMIVLDCVTQEYFIHEIKLVEDHRACLSSESSWEQREDGSNAELPEILS